MRILICLVSCPFPLDSGGNQATYNMIDYLRKYHSITLLCVNGSLKGFNSLKTAWPDVDISISNPDSEERQGTSVKDILKRIYHLLFRDKHNRVTLQEYKQNEMVLYKNDLFSFPPAYVSLVSEVTRRKEFDIIQVEFADLMGVVYALPPHTFKIFVHHEIRYLRLEQEKDTLAITTDYETLLVKSAKEQELFLLSRYNYVITLNDDDRNKLIEYLPAKQVHNSPFAIEIPVMKNVTGMDQSDQNLVFLGGEAHYPNLDAVSWFTESIWPTLISRKPQLKCYIIGNWSKNAISYFQDIPNIFFPGFIEDLQNVLSNAIMIVPIRIGSGIRVKILEAIAHKTPLVTTSIGKGTIPISDRKECVVANTEDEFSSGILELLEDKELQKSLTTNALESLNRFYTKEACGNLRNAIYNNIPQ